MDFLVLRKGLQEVAYPNAFIPFYEVSKDSHYVIIIRKKGYLDQLHIDVEAMKEVYEMGPQKIAEVEKKIEAKMRGMIGIGMKVKLVAPKSIARSEGKAKRVIDERTK
jgi:phenylacetate-CoA ligase